MYKSRPRSQGSSFLQSVLMTDGLLPAKVIQREPTSDGRSPMSKPPASNDEPVSRISDRRRSQLSKSSRCRISSPKRLSSSSPKMKRPPRPPKCNVNPVVPRDRESSLPLRPIFSLPRSNFLLDLEKVCSIFKCFSAT